MKLGILIVVLLVYCCSTKKQQPDCRNLRTGKFLLKAPDLGDEYTIERTKYVQVEKSKKTGIITKFSVEWVSPCSYKMKFLPTESQIPDTVSELMKQLKAIPTTVEILNIGTNYYTFEVSKENVSMKLRDTIWIVK